MDDAASEDRLKKDEQCGDCHGTDLRIGNIRDIHAKGTNRAVARTVWVRCRDCGNSWPVLKRIASDNAH